MEVRGPSFFSMGIFFLLVLCSWYPSSSMELEVWVGDGWYVRAQRECPAGGVCFFGMFFLGVSRRCGVSAPRASGTATPYWTAPNKSLGGLSVSNTTQKIRKKKFF